VGGEGWCLRTWQFEKGRGGLGPAMWGVSSGLGVVKKKGGGGMWGPNKSSVWLGMGKDGGQKPILCNGTRGDGKGLKVLSRERKGYPENDCVVDRTDPSRRGKEKYSLGGEHAQIADQKKKETVRTERVGRMAMLGVTVLTIEQTQPKVDRGSRASHISLIIWGEIPGTRMGN